MLKHLLALTVTLLAVTNTIARGAATPAAEQGTAASRVQNNDNDDPQDSKNGFASLPARRLRRWQPRPQQQRRLNDRKKTKDTSSSCRACVQIMNSSLQKMAKCTHRCNKKRQHHRTTTSRGGHRAQPDKSTSSEESSSFALSSLGDEDCRAMCAESARASAAGGVVKVRNLAKHACATLGHCNQKFILPTSLDSTSPQKGGDRNDAMIRIDEQSWAATPFGDDGGARGTSGGGESSTHTAVAHVNLTSARGDATTMPHISIVGITDLHGASNGSTIVFQKTRAGRDSANNDVIWHGTAAGAGDNSIGSASFMIHGSDGSVTGSFSTRTHAFSVDARPNGPSTAVVVKATAWRDFQGTDALVKPPPSDTTTAQLRASREQETDSDESTVLSFHTLSGNRDSYFEMESQQNQLQTKQQADRSPAVNNTDHLVVDVLVLVTQRAMCEYAGKRSSTCPINENNRAPIMKRIPVLQEETNNAMRDVGVAGARIRVVGIAILSRDYYVHMTTLYYIGNNKEIVDLRESTGADLVAMIAGRDLTGRLCGTAYLNSFESVTAQNCLDSFTFTHEIGHNFGCNHNREHAGKNHNYAYGYRVPGEFRTVMSYDSGCDCPVIPVFSANGYSYKGSRIGDREHDNARNLREQFSVAAAYMNNGNNGSITTLPTKLPTKQPTTES